MMKGVVIADKNYASGLKAAEKLIDETIANCVTKYAGEGMNFGGMTRKQQAIEAKILESKINRSCITQKEKDRAALLASLQTA